jgi:uncharacterized hydrophobic protein (TIGR00271 family)
VLFVRAFLTSTQADEVVRQLHEIEGVDHIARTPLIEPGREVVSCDVRPDRADAAVAIFDHLEIPETDVLMQRMSLIAPVGWRKGSRASLTNDTLIWADLLGEARVQARTVVRYLIFMAIAGIIAAFGVIDSDPILTVGAMALSPDLLPVSAACVGLVSLRFNLAARATITLAIGLGLSVVSACLMTMFLDSTSRLPHDLSHSSAGLGAVATVNTETVVVALVAGVAGMLAFETRAGQAVGVAISVTTIPAAALAGVAIALGSDSRALGSLKVLGTNVAMLLIGGTITLAIQKLVPPPHQPQPVQSPSPETRPATGSGAPTGWS